MKNSNFNLELCKTVASRVIGCTLQLFSFPKPGTKRYLYLSTLSLRYLGSLCKPILDCRLIGLAAACTRFSSNPLVLISSSRVINSARDTFLLNQSAAAGLSMCCVRCLASLMQMSLRLWLQRWQCQPEPEKVHGNRGCCRDPKKRACCGSAVTSRACCNSGT